jgi:hypothetical protein
MTMIPTIMNSLINLPKSERTFAVALVKVFRESIKKTLMLTWGRRLRYPEKNKIDTNTNTGIRIGRANFQI